MLRLWYPTPLHDALGVTDIFLLLVDVILGPLLILLMLKVGKKILVLDLTVIACLQLVALGYGLWTVAEGRLAWVVFNIDRFDLLQGGYRYASVAGCSSGLSGRLLVRSALDGGKQS